LGREKRPILWLKLDRTLKKGERVVAAAKGESAISRSIRARRTQHATR